MMKHRTILALIAAAAMVAVSCDNDDKTGGNEGPAERPEKEMDNSVIDPEIFTLLDEENSSISDVMDEYKAGKYWYAAYDLLEYYRSRTGITDSEITLIAPQITAAEQTAADEALAEKTDSLIRKPQLEWIAAQGLAYRTSYEEKYATAWVDVMDSFIASSDTLLTWTATDSENRLWNMVSAWEYFQQSTAVTPAFAARYLAYMCKDAQKLYEHVSESVDGAATLGRVARIFPEFKDASVWAAIAKEAGNRKYKTEWFEALNLDAEGLAEVKANYEAKDYQAAGEAFLKYWRTRNCTVNPNVDLANTTLSDTEKRWADMALRENGFRFYVKNYYENEAQLLPYSYLAADGKSINWQYCPTGDQEQRYQINRHEWMTPQAKAFYVTRDEKYVQGWMEVYKDWMDQNPSTGANAEWTWRSLEVACRLLGQCDIIDYTKTSTSITPEYLLWFLYEVQQQADYVRNNYSATTNHLISQAQAETATGILFPEMKEHDQWTKSGSDKLNNEVTAQYYNDGWLIDGDFHYHISSIEDFRSSMILAQLNGLTDVFPESYKTAMKAMADVVVNMTYPDYSVVNMTDTRCATWTKSVLQKNFAHYAELFPDTKYYSWMATDGTSGAKPSNLMKTFPDAGYYVLRSGWTSGDIMMVLENTTQTPKEQWHRQWDNNTFELYVAGRKFFQDSGCYTYNTGTTRSKYAATAAHNTMTLNGANVTTCRGQLLKSMTDVNTDILVLSNASYSGLTHRRSVFFVDRKFFVIVDEGYGTAAGTVNLNFHLPPVVAGDSDVTVDAANNAAYTSFSDGNNIAVRTFSPSTLTTTARTGFLSTNIDKSVDRKSYQVDIAKTADMAAARYITVILPSKTPSTETISASFPEDFSTSKVAATVTVGTKTYNLSVNL